MTPNSILRWNSPLATLVYRFIFADTSSLDQRPSSPGREEDSDTLETEQGRVIDLIATASPSRETPDDLIGLEVTTENLSDLDIREAQETSSEPSIPANIKEEETSETAAPDS